MRTIACLRTPATSRPAENRATTFLERPTATPGVRPRVSIKKSNSFLYGVSRTTLAGVGFARGPARTRRLVEGLPTGWHPMPLRSISLSACPPVARATSCNSGAPREIGVHLVPADPRRAFTRRLILCLPGEEPVSNLFVTHVVNGKTTDRRGLFTSRRQRVVALTRCMRLH